MKRTTASAVAGITLLVLLVADTSPAAFPGRNGLIVFASTTGENVTPQLFSIDPAGTGRKNLTRNVYSNHDGVWSADGRRIAFSEIDLPGSVLVVMNADGSEQRRLTSADQWASNPSWSPDGSLIAYWQAYGSAGIHVIRSDGSGDKVIGSGLGGSGSQPAWSPDGLQLALVTQVEGGNRALTVLDIGGGAPHDLARGGSFAYPAWSPDGSLIAYGVYAGGAGFDIHTIRPDGTGDRRIAQGGRAVWSPDSHRLAVVGDGNRSTSLTVMAADGSGAVSLSDHALDYPTWSPDSRSVAFVENGSDVYVANVDGSGPRPVTHEPSGSHVEHPQWSPDGSRILYQATHEDDDDDLYAVASDGTRVRSITQNSLDDFDPAWSPDGTAIAFAQGDARSSTSAIVIVRATGKRARRLTGNHGLDSSPSWSPEGSQIVFARGSPDDESSDLYVMRSDGSNVRRLGAGYDPAWSPDGRRIAFANGGALWLMRNDGYNRKLLVSPEETARALGVEPDDVDSLVAPAWSPDGKMLAFAAYYYPYGPVGRGDYLAALTIRQDGTGVDLRLSDVEPGRLTAEWSPDGKNLLFGAGNVLIEPVTGGEPLELTRLPGWSGDATWQPRCTAHGSARVDVLRGSAEDDVICGLGGNDRITGGGGTDRLFGEVGNDRINAKDSEFDLIGCGAGIDTVIADPIDLVGRDCERVVR